VCPQQLVNGLVGGQERQALQQAEAGLGQRAHGTQPRDAQRRLVNQLQGQAWLDPVGGLPAPAQQQVPGAQAEVLRHQQPQPQVGTTDLVGQELPDTAFQALRVTPGRAVVRPAHDHRHIRLRVRLAAVEFFFVSRSVR
jgi:hypothetical protein